MTIAFNQVPSSIRVPFLYAEFDNSAAQQGPNQQPYKVLLIGPKLAAGSAVEGSINLLSSSAKEADTLFGEGSLLAHMAQAFREVNTFNELYAVPMVDTGPSVAASGSYEFTSPATADGVFSIYIAGRKYSFAVLNGDTESEMATALAAAIQADTKRLVNGAVNGMNLDKVDFTARNKGIQGNDIDIRLNYQSDDALPGGVAGTITAMSGGTGQPDVSTVLAGLPDEQFILWVSAWSDSGNRAAIEQELDDRFGPIQQIDGYCHYYKKGNLGALTAFGSALNSQFTIVHRAGGPEHGAMQISRKVAVIARSAEIDPARPFQNLEVKGALPESDSERLPLEDRNTLLFNGISTDKIVGGKVILERVITTYQTNAAGAADISYLDLTTMLTLSYLRYDWRNYMLTKYPRHKLANDGTRFAEGQPIMTPGLGKAEAIKKFRQWELNGLVEGADQFKEQLIVERNASDPNRLDFMLPPDLINQLMVMGTQFKFLL
jgi:phage tail sheath gpL-like